MIFKNKHTSHLKLFNIDNEESDDEDGDQWYIDQNLENEETIEVPSAVKYGFAQTKSDVFNKLSVI